MEKGIIYDEKKQLMERIQSFFIKKMSEQKVAYWFLGIVGILYLCSGFAPVFRHHAWDSDSVHDVVFGIFIFLVAVLNYLFYRYWKSRFDGCQNPRQLLGTIDRMNRNGRLIGFVLVLICVAVGLYTLEGSMSDIVIVLLIMTAILAPFYIYYRYKMKKIGVNRLRELLSIDNDTQKCRK